MGILGIKYIGQNVFRRTIRAWETRIICPIILLLGSYLCKSSDSAVSNSPMVGQCFVRQSYVAKFFAFCRTVWDKKPYHSGQFQIFCTPALVACHNL